MNVTDRCSTRHTHKITVDFEPEDAPRFTAAKFAGKVDYALLRFSVEAEPNTGEIDTTSYNAVDIHKAVKIKKDGTPGLTGAGYVSLRYEALPEDVRAAIELRGRELAHEVTL